MVRVMAVLVLTLMVAGCATTTGTNQSANLLQVRVGDLEQQLSVKDEEVKDLKYQIKDLTYEIDRLKTKMPTGYSTGSVISAPRVSKGGSNDDILRVEASTQDVQQALKNAGYYAGDVDGKIGDKTRQAITAFQKDNNLKADGIIGQKTWAAMKTFLK
jgi:peptidoglycan hydrolase-like protein with peptidoglycan-binding domain